MLLSKIMKRIAIGIWLFLIMAARLPVEGAKASFQLNSSSAVTTSQNSYTVITGEHIRSFNSFIRVLTDGRIEVSERIVYDFYANSRHGIYRDIPYVKYTADRKKARMTIVIGGVTEPGTKAVYPFTTEDDGERLRLKIGDPNTLITGVHAYVIAYTVSGGLTYFNDHDELYWNSTGTGWQIPMEKATSEVALPEGIVPAEIRAACYTGSYGSMQQSCRHSAIRQTVNFETDSYLLPGQGLSTVVGFSKGIVQVVRPTVIIPFYERPVGRVVIAVIFVAALWWYVGYPIWIAVKWWRCGRDPKPTTGEVRAWFEPPRLASGRSLTPSEAGVLIDETADQADVFALIIHLASRGYFKIVEKKEGDFYFIKRKGYDRDQSLLPFELTFLSEMFSAEDEVRIKDKALYLTVAQVKKEIYQGLVDAELFLKNPNTIRLFYTVIAGFSLFTGNLPLLVSSLVFGLRLPRKTQKGADANAVVKSLRNFLKSQERQLNFQGKHQLLFEKLLAYAVAFGIEREWVKRFESLDLTYPVWYQAYGGGRFSSLYFINSMQSSFSSIQAASYPPAASSSGFAGGFSGGGGGGGGGGSW
ncbi:DUF2207 domain-containing protein [Candidatus Roizmanbacteria bacterium]|nr:DUF2207 domain-containing protein [Candidatus Roizmanbacteria bacterium]